MSVIAFDTLAYAKRLKDAGIPAEQAEAQTAALADALNDSTEKLATHAGLERLETSIRADIERLEGKFEVLEERTNGRFRLLQWMIGFNLALSVAVLWLLIRSLATP